ncbi:hypothetical protein DL771_010784 [Monosporascus sp. 5C6A]|nr:hypothetical protein DL771_010784 [Monosporascus sp. 5C6A]
MNHIVYRLLRPFGIKWGAVSRTTFSFVLGTIGSTGYADLQHYVYKTSTCGYSAMTSEIRPEGGFALSRVSFSYIRHRALAVTKNMKGLVASLNLGRHRPRYRSRHPQPLARLALRGATMVGAAMLTIFWFTFQHIDQEDFVTNTDFTDMKRDSQTENGIEKRHGGAPADSDSSNEKKAVSAPQEEVKIVVEKM